MEKEAHFIGKVAQKAIIYRDDHVLLTRDPRTPDVWELPGGRLNIDEDPKDGLQRELYEELGVQCEIKEVIFSKQFRQSNEKQQLSLVLVYTAILPLEATITVDPSEIVEFGWFSKVEALELKLYPEYSEALKVFYGQ
jgi:8-oxo-dGTP diphosphatase